MSAISPQEIDLVAREIASAESKTQTQRRNGKIARLPEEKFRARQQLQAARAAEPSPQSSQIKVNQAPQEILTNCNHPMRGAPAFVPLLSGACDEGTFMPSVTHSTR
jgi:hypothetical protein